MRPTAVKFTDASESELSILAIPYGGLLAGKDTDGEYFSKRTNLCDDWFPNKQPLLYQHGRDHEGPGLAAVGWFDRSRAERKPDGVWITATLNPRSPYAPAIKQLVRNGQLFASSGAMAHLIEVEPTGHIKIWPWTELSLTPSPANAYAIVTPASQAGKHYLGVSNMEDPYVQMQLDGLNAWAAKARLTAEQRHGLSASDFAYVDSSGGRHLPVHDLAHVRAAIALFSHQDFENPQAKKRAARRILQAAAHHGIAVSTDSDVSQAAKSASWSADLASLNHYAAGLGLKTLSEGTDVGGGYLVPEVRPGVRRPSGDLRRQLEDLNGCAGNLATEDEARLVAWRRQQEAKAASYREHLAHLAGLMGKQPGLALVGNTKAYELPKHTGLKGL